jgi:photosystem II stability/assembly factor-like uncharacterized protein
MRNAVFTLLAFAAAFAQSAPQVRYTRTKENLRGISVVSETVAWASGAHGTYLRMADGRIWIPDQVPGAEALDFRGVVAFSADEAFLMSSGPGDQSRIYHTADAGRHWQLQFTNKNPKGFFDSIAFWDRTHGIVLGDPIPDENGNLKFEVLMTDDGQTWNPISSAQLPPAIEGEGAFAASNSCVAILRSTQADDVSDGVGATNGEGTTSSRAVVVAEKNGTSAPEEIDPNIWFATGGKVARVFHSPDRGHTWQVFETPIVHGEDSQGIFSIAFRDATHGVIAGGDYKHPDQAGSDLAFTSDGGKTWQLSKIFPQFYYSAVAYDREYGLRENDRPKNPGKESNSANDNIRLFLAGSKSIYDFRPPQDPIRIGGSKKSDLEFNAIGPRPSGGALIVGAKGTLAVIP